MKRMGLIHCPVLPTGEQLDGANPSVGYILWSSSETFSDNRNSNPRVRWISCNMVTKQWVMLIISPNANSYKVSLLLRPGILLTQIVMNPITAELEITNSIVIGITADYSCH